MLVITSGAYIGSELESEFGLIPPAFLPVGNQRLYRQQHTAGFPCNDVYLTVPDSYTVSKEDREALHKLSIKLVSVPADLTLGESIVYALNLIEMAHEEPLYLLHGDTLLSSLWPTLDTIGISETADNYQWAEYNRQSGLLSSHNEDPEEDFVANGYFTFSKPRTLIRCIMESQWRFIDGVNQYHKTRPLAPVQSEGWLDFGHSHTYYRAKSKLTTQRAFNSLRITQQTVYKSSQDRKKMTAEATWFESLPCDLKRFTPSFFSKNLDAEPASYQIEYLHLTALNELYVFAQLPKRTWRTILDACFDFIRVTQQHSDKPSSGNHLHALFQNKTAHRLSEFESNAPIDLNRNVIFNGNVAPSVYSLAEIATDHLRDLPQTHHIIHGDFCFSNLLFDFRSGSIKAIDPRGIAPSGALTSFGLGCYDIAKLAHSVIGVYDFIIAGFFEAKIENKNALNFKLPASVEREQIQAYFVAQCQSQLNINAKQLLAMQIHLFLSMLPLHADRPERQLGFIANSYRLYLELEKRCS